MTVKPRTIDNLGVDSSVRYAKDKELLDAKFVEESKWLGKKAEIPVTRPYIPSEYEELFTVGKTVPWALFDPPPVAEFDTRSLFSFQLIPSLGTPEKQEEDMEKLSALEDALNKKKKKQKEQGKAEEEEKEKEKLIALFKCIQKLDRTLILINSRRNQYQRG